MYKQEEEKLQDYKKMYDTVPVSIDAIDDAILAGFQRAKSEQKMPRRKNKWLYSTVAAAVLLVGFFTSVRLSPVMADYVAILPGMEKIVEMIRFDKGKMSAIGNDYYQEIGVSDSDTNLTFTIDGAITDEKGMVLFYNIESDKKQKNLFIDEVKLQSKTNKDMEFGASYDSLHSSDEGETNFTGVIDYFFTKPFDSKEFVLSLKISGDTTGEFIIPFTLTKDMKGKKTYPLNETVTIDGQKVTFINAIIHPLRVEVHLKMDPANTKKILNLDDLRLVDENGEVWNKVNSGVTATLKSENEQILYLQSNYFHQPKQLYLALNKLQAVNRDEEFLVVDLDSEQIIKQPQGDHLSKVKVEEGYLHLQMVTEKEFPNYIFDKIYDQEGKEIQSTSYTIGTRDDKRVKDFSIEIPNIEDLNGTISIELSSFPNWIEGDVKVKLK